MKSCATFLRLYEEKRRFLESVCFTDTKCWEVTQLSKPPASFVNTWQVFRKNVRSNLHCNCYHCSLLRLSSNYKNYPLSYVESNIHGWYFSFNMWTIWFIGSLVPSNNFRPYAPTNTKTLRGLSGKFPNISRKKFSSLTLKLFSLVAFKVLLSTLYAPQTAFLQCSEAFLESCFRNAAQMR